MSIMDRSYDQRALVHLQDQAFVSRFLNFWTVHARGQKRLLQPDLDERVAGLYELVGLPPPRVVVCDSPKAVLDLIPKQTWGYQCAGPVRDRSDTVWGRIQKKILTDCHLALLHGETELAQDFRHYFSPEGDQYTTDLVQALFRRVHLPMSRLYDGLRAIWKAFIGPQDQDGRTLFTIYGRRRTSGSAGPFCDLCGCGDDDLMIYDFLERVGGVCDSRALRVWRDFITAGVWDAALTPDEAYLCRPPTQVHVNNRKQLHNDQGPAVRWADGCENYFLHANPHKEGRSSLPGLAARSFHARS